MWSAAVCLQQRGQDASGCKWRVASRSPAQWEIAASLEGHTDAICSISWSPDQKRILTASADGTAKIWNELGHQHSNIGNHFKDAWRIAAVLGSPDEDSLVRDAAWSPDSTRVLMGSLDGRARVFQRNFNAEQLVAKLPVNMSEVISGDDVVPSGWGSDPETSTITKNATVSSVTTSQAMSNVTTSTMKTSTVTTSTMTTSSTTLTTTSIQDYIIMQYGPRREIWDITAQLSSQPDSVLAVDWSSPQSLSGQVLAAMRDRIACVHKSERARTREGEDWLSFNSCATEDLRDRRAHGDTLEVSSFARSGSIWEANIDNPMRWGLAATLEAAPHLMVSVRWSPDGQRLLTGGLDGVARIWQLFPEDFHGSGRPHWDVLTSHRAHSEAVWAVAWAPDGQRVLTAGRDGSTHIWRPFQESGSWVKRTSLTPEGQGFWEAPAQTEKTHIWQAFQESGPWIKEASLTAENGPNIEPARTNTAHHSRWDTARIDTWQPEFNMGWVSRWSPVWVAAWSPDGHRVLTGSRDGSARIWLENASSVDRWSIEATLIGHSHEIWALAWSPDSLEVLTSDQAGMARLWRAGDKVAAAKMVAEDAVNTSNASNVTETLFEVPVSNVSEVNVMQPDDENDTNDTSDNKSSG